MPILLGSQYCEVYKGIPIYKEKKQFSSVDMDFDSLNFDYLYSGYPTEGLELAESDFNFSAYLFNTNYIEDLDVIAEES